VRFYYSKTFGICKLRMNSLHGGAKSDFRLLADDNIETHIRN
jgi:hypothetical protein